MPKALTTPLGLQKKNKSQKKDPSNQLNLGPPHSRDLAIQDFTVVVVPGNRLSCLPRARRERAALRAQPNLWAGFVKVVVAFFTRPRSLAWAR